ncbi:MAG: hypothetical protein ACOYU3_08640 [Bacillota bacterium]
MDGMVPIGKRKCLAVLLLAMLFTSACTMEDTAIKNPITPAATTPAGSLQGLG